MNTRLETTCERMREKSGVGTRPTAGPTSTNPKDALGRAKPQLGLLPGAAKIIAALAMEDGARKYGPYNWRDMTVAATVYLDACERHLLRLRDGEDIDPESGVHHLGHLIASAAIYLDAEVGGTLVDDRPKPGPSSRLIAEHTRAPAPVSIPVPETAVTELRQTQTAAEIVKAVDSDGAGPPVFVVPASAAPRARRCYIAGPMSGYPQFNFPAFDAARDLALSRGLIPISPADIDRKHGIHEGTSADELISFGSRRTFLRRDVDALLSLRAEHGDAIALLPGWLESRGAMAELYIARWLGLKVLDATTMEPFPGRHGLGIAVVSLGNILEAGLRDYLAGVKGKRA